jgi:hypothetical protein
MTSFLTEQSQLVREIGSHVTTMDDGRSPLGVLQHECLAAVHSLPVSHNERMDLVRDYSGRCHPAALERSEDQQPACEHACLALAHRRSLLQELWGLGHLHL